MDIWNVRLGIHVLKAGSNQFIPSSVLCVLSIRIILHAWHFMVLHGVLIFSIVRVMLKMLCPIKMQTEFARNLV